MDFLDPNKKRSHRIRLLVGYALVAIALAMGTMVLVFLSYGYDLDRKTGSVVQNGLVFVAAHPASADIYVNGEQRAHTDTRMSLRGGQYNIELRRAGYRPWMRSISLQGGSIERLDYPLLFPITLKTKDVELYSNTPPFITESPDRHWALIQQPGQLLKFDIMDLNNDNSTISSLTLPANIVTASLEPNQSWQNTEWSTDNRHVLIEHRFGASSEFVMIDRENPASSFNVNQLFKQSPSQVMLRDKKFDSLYLYSNGTIQTGDVKAATVTPFLTHVLAFKPRGDKTVLFVSDQANKPGKTSLKLVDSGNTYTLRELPANDTYLLDLARFDNRWYIAAAAKSENRAYIYRNPQDTLKQHGDNNALLPAIVLNITNPQFVSFSDSARFVAVQSGSKFAAYDADSDRRYYYDLEVPIGDSTHAVWMDANRLTAVTGGKAMVFDFDGTNKQNLVPSDSSLSPFFDGSYKWLYTIGPSLSVAGRAAVTRTELVVK